MTAESERIATINIMLVAYYAAVAAGLLAFLTLAVVRYIAAYNSIESSVSDGVRVFIAISIASIVAIARAIALLWSTVDASRRRYISCALGVIISIAFMWHELANADLMCELAGLKNDFIKSAIRFTIVAAMMIEARLIAGLFRK